MSALIDLTGQTFGKLTVKEKMPSDSSGKTFWLCGCVCGNTCVVYSRSLRRGLQKSCGCGRQKDLAGERFGSLTVLGRSEKYVYTADQRRKRLWKCRCDCGEIVYRLSEKLRQEKNSACPACATKAAVTAMKAHAGYVEGTQLTRIGRTSVTTANTSGVRGVFYNKRTGKWRATLKFQGHDHYLGEYTDKDEAVKARWRAEEEYFMPILEQYGI